MTTAISAPPHVVGVDTSLTASGIAWPDGTTMTHGRAGLTGHTTTPGARSVQLSDLAQEIYERIVGRTHTDGSARPVLVAVESVPTSGTRVDTERCFLWWRLVEKLTLNGIPVLAVPPTTIKLYISGMGNANKREVIASVKRDLPQWEIRKTGKTGKVLATDDDNKADAAVLVAIGCHLLGHPIAPVGDRYPHRERALEKLILPPGIRL